MLLTSTAEFGKIVKNEAMIDVCSFFGAHGAIGASLAVTSTGSPDVAHAVFMLAAVASVGLALGSIRVKGIGLGTAGVLFAGIIFGHFGVEIDHTIMDFVREFGLILFVFCIGLQLGPSFFASLQRVGLRLNLLAASIVVMGAGITMLTPLLLKIDPAASLGLFSGATTNTPSLGAVQQTVALLGGANNPRGAFPALAYAVSYPVGIFGIIGALLLLRRMFRIDAEAEALAAKPANTAPPLLRRNLILENANLDGVRLAELPGREESRVVVSRIRRAAETKVQMATPDFVMHVGDSMLAVGTDHGLDQFRRIVGRVGTENLMEMPSDATFERLVVTKPDVLGRTIAELGLEQLYGVTATRVIRGDMEMPPNATLRLQFGDVVQLVGTPPSIAQAGATLGNSIKALNETHFIPIFVGIALGVFLGLRPLEVPGLPVPLKLGLAGGPLVLAILLGRLGHFRSLVWHMPLNANLAFRELGISLFLACVGLKAGAQFFASVFTVDGLKWVLAATMITLVPIMLVGIFARKVLKMNFAAISGLLSGSMTDPPALAFASAICKSDSPALSYATVYPLTMLLRIVAAQLLTLWLWR